MACNGGLDPFSCVMLGVGMGRGGAGRGGGVGLVAEWAVGGGLGPVGGGDVK
jgi:hypothetical protein